MSDPREYTPSPTDFPSKVLLLLDGDPVNRDNAFKETSPGATPYGTLGLLWDVLFGLRSAAAKFTKLMVGDSAPDPGSEGVGIEGKLRVGAGAATPSAAGGVAIEQTLEVGSDTMVHGDTALVGALDVGGGFTAGSGATITGQTTTDGLKVDETFERGESTPSVGATTLTYNVTDGPILWLDQHTAACAVTLASPAASGSKRYEVDIFWCPANGTDDLTVKNAGAATIGGLGDAGWIRFRWDGSAWRGFGGCNFSGGTFIQAA